MRLPNMNENETFDAIRNMFTETDTATTDTNILQVDEYLKPISTTKPHQVDFALLFNSWVFISILIAHPFTNVSFNPYKSYNLQGLNVSCFTYTYSYIVL